MLAFGSSVDGAPAPLAREEDEFHAMQRKMTSKQTAIRQ